MSESKIEQVPTEQLAEKITDQLCAKGLIPKTKRGELLGKLKTGQITSQDWRLLIELGLPRPDRGAKNASTT